MSILLFLRGWLLTGLSDLLSFVFNLYTFCSWTFSLLCSADVICTGMSCASVNLLVLLSFLLNFVDIGGGKKGKFVGH